MKNLSAFLIFLASFFFAEHLDGQCFTTNLVADDCDQTNNEQQFWNSTDWWAADIESHNLADAPVNLKIILTGTCGNVPQILTYELLLDLDGDGSLETSISGDSTAPAGFIFYDNIGKPGTQRQFDFRPVAAQNRYHFVLEQEILGNTRTAQIKWKSVQNTGNQSFTNPQLPYGKCKIRWFSAAVLVGEKAFEIRDCHPPVVNCLNNLSANIMPTGMITIWGSDFLQSGADNYTPADQLVYSIRKSGTGAGFPHDNNGNPIPGVTFTCSELGTQFVELWAKDKDGNANYCETYLSINDQFSCGGDPGFTICLETESGNGLGNATIEIVNQPNPALPPTNLINYPTNQSGCFGGIGFLPFPATATVTPIKDDNPLNGVTTYDLLLMFRNILGKDTIKSPYKSIAADVNRSGSITTNDIVELRKLILGIYTEFPNNTSWRFVLKNFQFPNLLNPFSTQFPEKTFVSELHDGKADFVAMKIGDINGNAVTDSFQVSDDRSPQFFTLENQKLTAGQTATIPIFLDKKQDLAGFQMEFLTDPTAIEIEEILPGAATDFGRENYASAADGKVAVSWVSTENRDLKNSNSPLISLKIKALRDVSLSNVFKIDDSRLRPEAYFGRDEIRKIDLRFLEKNRVGEAFKIYPNPAADQLFLEISNEKTGAISWQIFDLTGREISRGESQNQPEKLDVSHLPTGSFYLKMNVGGKVFGQVFFKN